jgi:hypothetical protein
MDCPRCEKPMFRALGNCKSDHFVCVPCDLEWCTLFKEEEHLGPDPEARRLAYSFPKKELPKKKMLGVLINRPKPSKKTEREKLWNKIILRAEDFLGDIMGEYAESQYSEQGGSVGMVEGRVQLTNEEIKNCMFEALSLCDNHGNAKYGFGVHFDLDGLQIDRQKLVDFWFRHDFWGCAKKRKKKEVVSSEIAV